MAARDLYTSTWFDKASAYARQVADEWYILSAKYGLVSPGTVIAPYEQTLTKMPAAERQAWAGRVLKNLGAVLTPGDHVVILAGQAYRANLVGPICESGDFLARVACTLPLVLAHGQRIDYSHGVADCGRSLEKHEDFAVHSRLV